MFLATTTHNNFSIDLRGLVVEYSKFIGVQRVADSFIGESKYIRAEPNLIAKLMSRGVGVAETPELQH